MISFRGRGGRLGLSGASVEGDNGGGERLPWRRCLWLRGKAAAERTFLMLLARYTRPEPRRWKVSPLVGLLCPSLGALALNGSFRELARVGIGNGGLGGLLDSGRLGLLERP